MMYGMTWEQYWFGSPWMARDYKDTYFLKRRVQNENMWLQGAYIRDALESVIGTAFGNRKIEYAKKPYDIFQKTHAEKQAEIENERQRIIDYLNSLQTRSKKQGVDQHGKP